MASDLLDQHDQELMSGLQALGPLLLGPRKWMAENDEDRHTKRHKAVKVEDGSPELADMVRLMAQIVLNHEKSIQHYHRQTAPLCSHKPIHREPCHCYWTSPTVGRACQNRSRLSRRPPCGPS